ncbi:hypothetical protein [Amycolatopsis anabasis]|uniref:hypothetical protein n=1 Tax=Amycolatopsis anabasis TaxID=1840409 RepID=UPI00131E0A9B|nr:hypothetical protein [Amycolatopsis anabasis]
MPVRPSAAVLGAQQPPSPPMTLRDQDQGRYVVRIDYTTTCAHIIRTDDHTGEEVVAAYGPGAVRHTLATFLAPDGWELVPGGHWVISPSADGRDHPVRYRPSRQASPTMTDHLPHATEDSDDGFADYLAGLRALLSDVDSRLRSGVDHVGRLTESIDDLCGYDAGVDGELTRAEVTDLKRHLATAVAEIRAAYRITTLTLITLDRAHTAAPSGTE